ncbi:copper ion binding protein [Sporohalobacter salinus]|uniref:copper ion binding protein n=1 Tax=Sporohalobacter salinus TaxID=1494606 RepID=UPI001960B3C0|nr:copper ion binding protein [Sporohalobacter salinus]MBM7624707.1 copper chaperone [Sporohalobacter salinus]
MKKLSIDVEGMSCSHCKNSVEKALTDSAGVESAEVDLDAESVTVKFDDSKVQKDGLKEAIEDAGPYKVNKGGD